MIEIYENNRRMRVARGIPFRDNEFENNRRMRVARGIPFQPEFEFPEDQPPNIYDQAYKQFYQDALDRNHYDYLLPLLPTRATILSRYGGH